MFSCDIRNFFQIKSKKYSFYVKTKKLEKKDEIFISPILRKVRIRTHLAPDAKKADLLFTKAAALGMEISIDSLNMDKPK